MMIRSLITAFLVAMGSCTIQAETAVEQVVRQFREYCLHESTDHGERLLDDVELPKVSPSQAGKLFASLDEAGSWSDIDYSSHARSSWPPCTHLTRTLGLVVFALRAETAAVERAKCLAAAHRALAYWKLHDYRCPNWWYNEIGVPKLMGNIALLLGNELTDDERTHIANTVLTRAKVGAMTGQNRVWLAANGVMRAALISDETLMRQATGVIQEELRAGNGEGIQPDWSFHQHGPQQQFGNYGMAYAVEMSRWATVLRGTPWALPEDKAEILRNYLLDGEDWVAWRGMMDISACGRQLFPDSLRNKAGVVRGVMRVMAVADASHAREYLASVARNQETAVNDLVGDRFFWKSDYLIHRRAAFMATLKMSSQRVIGGETVNNENVSGIHLADGATYFYRTGHEYDDIFPTWDWRMIPGVTCSLDDGSLRWPTVDLKKESNFVGGVSNGADGCAVMDLHRDNLSAKKAWFFVGDTVICLGTDIYSTGVQPVVTTVNQCLLKTDVTVQRAGKRESLSGATQNLENVDWVEQDGVRYTPLEPETWLASAVSRTGNWRKVFDSPATPKANIAKDVFMLWIAHGSQVNGASYAYSVAPAEETAVLSFKVLSNTEKLQAVKAVRTGAEKSEWAGAVFWDAGSAELNGTLIKVDAPCLLVVDSTRITVSDPTQKIRTVRLEVAGKSAVVKLPQGGDAGNSVEVPELR